MAHVRKILLVILDGMGDRPCSELEGRTPLEAAATPTMDRLAKEGRTGLMDVIAPGIAPGSDTAHLALLGYDPLEVYTGRGAFEAAGTGLDIRRGDVAFRCNFGTVDELTKVTDRRAGRISSGTDQLAAALNGMLIEDVEVIFKEAVEHRAVLVLRGDGLSAEVSDVDPHEVGTEVLSSKPLAPEARKTARILNEFTRRSYEIMKDHEVNVKRMEDGLAPANIALARGAGSPPDVPCFNELHRMKGAAVVGISLVAGVCRVSGLDIMDVPGATGGLDTDIGQKMDATIKALGTHDFVLLHVKGTDICGHDDDPQKKADFIAKVDVELGNLLDSLGPLADDMVICVTADHSTPCCVMDHSADPVPLLIWGKGLRRDQVDTFGEHAAAHGGLGKIRGKDLLNTLKGQAGRTDKCGA
jgi:2,3-bisphosphoglycerate-independent phosphoglycerate mutase